MIRARRKRPTAAVVTPAAAALLALQVPAWAQDPPRATDLEGVEVSVSTATRTERLLSDVPVRTEVLSGEDLALRAVADFSQAAELINGLRVESNCQNCNTSEIQLLGLGGAYNQLLFDGTPLMSALGSVYGLEQIPAAFIRRIEVVKGGGSALYGPGAVAGVVNLVSQPPLRSGGFVQAGVDEQRGRSLQRADARLDLADAAGRFGASVAMQGMRNGAIDFDGDGYSEITAKDLRAGGAQAWFTPGDSTRVRADFQHTRERRRGGNRLDQPEYLANIAESLDTRYQRGGLVWEQLAGEDFDFRLGYSFADIRRDSFYGGLGEVPTDPAEPGYDPAQLDPGVPGSAASVSYAQYGYTENPLHYFDSQFNLRLGTHALAFGAQYKRERLRDFNLDAAGNRLRLGTDARFSNLGVFVQDEWSPSGALDLVLGARLDKSSELDDPVLSPRLALAYQADPRLKLRAGISTGFRAPEVFSEDVHVDTLGAEPIRIRNAEGLREERALTGMLGLDWRSDPAEPRWTVDATASYTELRDTFILSEIRTDADGSLYQVRDNASGSRVAGFEANLGFQPRRSLRLSAGTAWYRSRHEAAQVVFDDTPEGGDTVIALRDYLKTPRWTGVAQLTWEPRETLQTFLGARYTGRMQALNNRLGVLKRTPDFWVLDAGAAWHRHLGEREVTVSFGVRNLFDQRQRDLETGAARDSDYVYGPRFARAGYVAIRYAF